MSYTESGESESLHAWKLSIYVLVAFSNFQWCIASYIIIQFHQEHNNDYSYLAT